MRILVVNPNTTASMNSKIETCARSVAGNGVEVVCRNPKTGPVSIEGGIVRGKF
jgi:allantoin racemase